MPALPRPGISHGHEPRRNGRDGWSWGRCHAGAHGVGSARWWSTGEGAVATVKFMTFGAPRLFDHFVGGGTQRLRYFEAEGAGALHVDHELEPGWCLDGKLARFRAPEDAIGIRRRTPVLVHDIRTVRDQAADLSERAGPIDGRDTVARRKRSDLRAMADREGIRDDDQAAVRLARLSGDDKRDLGHVLDRRDDRLHAEGRCGSSEGGQVTFNEGRRWRVEQQADPGDTRRNLLEQLDPLAA